MRLGFPLWLVLAGTLAGAACSHQQERAAQAAPQPQVLEYIGEWGTKGDGPGQFSSPKRMAVDKAGNIYVADAGSGYVHKFSVTGEPRLSFQDDRRNIYPESVAVDEGGAIYAADARRGSIFIYLPDGDRFKELRCCVGARTGPLRVAVNSEGLIFVADGRAFGVRKYSPRGRLIGSWRRKDPATPAVEQASDIDTSINGSVYVSDAPSSAIHVFTSDGSYQRSLKIPETQGPATLAGIAVSDRYVLAADPAANAVHIWARSGEYRLRSDLGGRLQGLADSPQDVGITATGELLVLDSTGKRVLRFRLNL